MKTFKQSLISIWKKSLKLLDSLGKRAAVGNKEILNSDDEVNPLSTSE